MASLLGYQLRRAQMIVFQDFASAASPDLTPGLFHILMLVACNPDVAPSAIAAELGADRSTVVPMIRKLEEMGWVVRRPDPSDRRGVKLSATPQGQAILDKAVPGLRRLEAQLTEGLSAAERARLLELLAKVGARQTAESL